MPLNASSVASGVAIGTVFEETRNALAQQLPQAIAIVAQGNEAVTYPATPLVITTSAAAGAVYGFGSPIELIAQMLFPANGDGVGSIPVTVYPAASGVGLSTGNIAPDGAQTADATHTIRCGGVESIPFTILTADTVAIICDKIKIAVDSTLSWPTTSVDNATDVDLPFKWLGTSPDGVTIEVLGPDVGGAFVVTAPVGGTTNPSVAAPIALIGSSSTWRTMIVSGMESDDTDTFDLYEAFAEAQWADLVHAPPVAFTGNSATSVAAVVISDARKADRGNAYVTAIGSISFDFLIAARGVARMAFRANDNPARGYNGMTLTGIIAGADGVQDDHDAQDVSVKGGASTGNVVDGVAVLGDVVTFYHPDGETPPAYRYVVVIVKVSQILYNLDLIFNGDKWQAAPLLPDSQATTNKAVRKPKDAKADVAEMLDGLGLSAIISDPTTAKTLTTAVIDGGNPDRMNVGVHSQVSGTTRIIAITNNFGFFFGTTPLV